MPSAKLDIPPPPAPATQPAKPAPEPVRPQTESGPPSQHPAETDADEGDDIDIPSAEMIRLAKEKRQRLRGAHMAPGYIPSDNPVFQKSSDFKKAEDGVKRGSDDESGDDDPEDLRLKFSGGMAASCFPASYSVPSVLLIHVYVFYDLCFIPASPVFTILVHCDAATCPEPYIMLVPPCCIVVLSDLRRLPYVLQHCLRWSRVPGVISRACANINLSRAELSPAGRCALWCVLASFIHSQPTPNRTYSSAWALSCKIRGSQVGPRLTLRDANACSAS